MSNPHGSNSTGQGSSRLLNLPSELRNSIYEYVLADVQDSVCINLERGDNSAYRSKTKRAKKPKAVPIGEKTSRLSLLLTCGQINREASSMAFSKMSMSLKSVFSTNTSFFSGQISAGDRRLNSMLADIARIFDPLKLSFITSMSVPSTEALQHLVFYNRPGLSDPQSSESCTAKCSSLAKFTGPIHKMFHKVTRITITGEDRLSEPLYQQLTKGAPWLSVTMQPSEIDNVLSAFSNLEEIIVSRKCGKQVCKVVDGKVFAAESGLPMRGLPDWLPNVKL